MRVCWQTKIEATIWLMVLYTMRVLTINTTFLAQRHTWGSHVGHGLGHGEPCGEAIMGMRTQFLYLMPKLQWNTDLGSNWWKIDTEQLMEISAMCKYVLYWVKLTVFHCFTAACCYVRARANQTELASRSYSHAILKHWVCWKVPLWHSKGYTRVTACAWKSDMLVHAVTWM